MMSANMHMGGQEQQPKQHMKRKGCKKRFLLKMEEWASADSDLVEEIKAPTPKS